RAGGVLRDEGPERLRRSRADSRRERPGHRPGVLPPQQPLQVRLVAVAASAPREPLSAAGNRGGRGPAAAVHLRAAAPGAVPHRSHAALALAAALHRGPALLPRRGGREIHPPDALAVARGPGAGAVEGVKGDMSDQWGEVLVIGAGIAVQRLL